MEVIPYLQGRELRAFACACSTFRKIILASSRGQEMVLFSALRKRKPIYLRGIYNGKTLDLPIEHYVSRTQCIFYMSFDFPNLDALDRLEYGVQLIACRCNFWQVMDDESTHIGHDEIDPEKTGAAKIDEILNLILSQSALICNGPLEDILVAKPRAWKQIVTNDQCWQEFLDFWLCVPTERYIE